MGKSTNDPDEVQEDNRTDEQKANDNAKRSEAMEQAYEDEK